ncbi:MAG: peptidylprolyl isomerase [Methylohalobius crimeensis]
MNVMDRRERQSQRTDLAYHRLRAAMAQFGAPPEALDSQQRAAVERVARNAHTLESRVLSSPEARDVVIPRAVLNRSLETVVSRYENEEAMETDLRRNGLSREVFKQALQRELKVEAILDRIKSRAVKVDEVEVRLFYHLHYQRFFRPETRTARHLLITVNDDFPENQREAALARIERIAEGLRRKPRRFGEQAAKHSECPTALQEGLLGRVPKGQLYPELDEVLFQLKEGEISKIIESSIGFHLLLCEQVHPAGQVPFEEVKARIREQLQQRRARICVRNWLAALSVTEHPA